MRQAAHIVRIFALAGLFVAGGESFSTSLTVLARRQPLFGVLGAAATSGREAHATYAMRSSRVTKIIQGVSSSRNRLLASFHGSIAARSSNTNQGSDCRDEDDGFAAMEWPAPNPSQVFVAHARDGRRYEPGADISVAATRATTAAATAVGGGVDEEDAPRIRMVVTDLDGTLLGPDKKVSARTLEVVRRARAKGIIFVPASGRSKAGMFSAMEELGEELKRDGAPFICMNGLTVYGQGNGSHGKIIYSEVMCAKLAAKVVGFWRSHPLAKAAGVSLCGSEGDTVVVERLDDRTRGYAGCLEPLPVEVGDMMDAIDAGMKLNRLIFFGATRPAVDAFKDDLTEHLKDHPAELTRGVPEMIEVLPPGASKAVGLKALLKEMNIRPEEVVALGDEENDVEMLRAVGHGVAMGQASLDIRKAARYTAPSHALHGVAVAIETFCSV